MAYINEYSSINMHIMNNKRLIIAVTIAVVMLAGAYLIFRNKPTSENKVSQQNQPEIEKNEGTVDTSSWKTYRNEEYRFEVKYPETGGWRLGESLSMANDKAVSIYYDYQKQNDKPQLAGVGISPEMPGYGLSAFLNFVKENNDKLVRFDFANHKAFMLPGDDGKNWDKFQSIMDGKGDSCKRDMYIGIHIENLPANWKTKNEQISILCDDPRFAPILREILNSIRFF